MTTYRIETWEADSLFKVPQNRQIWKSCDKKWRHNDVITKKIEDNGEMRISTKPNKLFINRKVLMRAIQKCTSYWIWATISKVVGILLNFGIFYNARSPNMVMSRDPRSKFRKFFRESLGKEATLHRNTCFPQETGRFLVKHFILTPEISQMSTVFFYYYSSICDAHFNWT